MYPTWYEFVLGVTLDLALGDPRWLPHPVRWMGRMIVLLERGLYDLFGAQGRRFAGILLVAIAAGASAAVTIALLRLPVPLLGSLLAVYLVFTLLALRSLDLEALGVVLALRRQDLELARQRLSGIVGRETRHLDEREILRAVTETVAENLSDGVIAPVFYLMLGGLPAMVAYKCINTLDSMVGYKNERYREFGWAAARLDDLANYAPARLSALVVLAAAAFLGLSPRAGWRIIRRDGAKQPSPNAGFPEAAVAGVLGVRLGGANRYGGRVVDKPFIGDPVNELSTAQYGILRRILYLSGLAVWVAAALELYWIEFGVRRLVAALVVRITSFVPYL
jgi:adenosylcobinamide-phosphate synthase